MSFILTKEQLMVRKMAREFAEKELKPLAAIIDEEERYPSETIPKLAKMGMFGAPYPKELGGQGGNYFNYVLALEEISKVCAATASIISTHASVSIYCLQLFGTEEQRKYYMPILMNDGKMMGFALTEPNAGTDAGGVRTKAIREGDHYILNGTKMFISGAGHNDYYIILAMTDKSKGTKGITAFIVDKNNPGLKCGKAEKTLGIRSVSSGEVILQNCIVPETDRLGVEGKGFKIALASLDSGRIGMGTQALGIAQACIDEAVKYVKERKQFGRRISQFQNTQFVLADLQTRVDAGRLLVWRAATLKDEGKKFSQEAAMAKLYNSEMANECARKCLQMLGGYGYTREYPIERMLRDAKITEIYEGTSEAQKMVISRNMGVY